jgi:hypothetical protein
VVNFIKWVLVIVLTANIIWIAQPEEVSLITSYVTNGASSLVLSNRYTQPDDYSDAVMETFENEFQLRYTDEELLEMGYSYHIENENFVLYFEPNSFSIILHDLQRDYMYSSRAEFQGISQTRENNTATRHLMNSGIWIDYVRKQNVSRATQTRVSLLTLADVEYVTDGSLSETQDALSVFAYDDNSYDENAFEMSVIQTQHQLLIQLQLSELQMAFDVQLTLHDEGFDVSIPAESLVETSDIYGLTQITLFPYFGAVRENFYPGYLVVPDQSGALIRFDDMIETSFRERFYGIDEGLSGSSRVELNMPIAGFMHEIGEHGFYMNVIDGAETSLLNAEFWSASSKYHRMYVTHQIRPIFRTIINQAGDGRDEIPEALTSTDFKMTYTILEDATYVGMANHYSASLNLDQNTLNQVPTLMSLLLGDREPNFIGTRYLNMTSFEFVETLVPWLIENDIDASYELLGWSQSGHMYEWPFTTRLSSEVSAIETLFNEQNINYYFMQDYVTSTSLASRINYNQDVTRDLSRLKMSYTMPSLNAQTLDFYFIDPTESMEFFENDRAFFVSRQMSTQYLGNTLFSYYDDHYISRSSALSIYLEMLANMKNPLMSSPHAYAFDEVGAYKEFDITHANYAYYTDLVPLLPLVLKTYIEVYASPLNFNAMGIERLLQMVDFGIFPHYILTEAPTSTMRFTHSSLYFTTEFQTFEAQILANQNVLSEAMEDVMNARIVSRTVLIPGVVENVYDNGIVHVINYLNSSYQYEDVMVSPLSVEVLR